MTKKETLRMNNLIAENIRLQDEITKHLGMYGDLLRETISLRARIETMREVMNWPIGSEHEAA